MHPHFSDIIIAALITTISPAVYSFWKSKWSDRAAKRIDAGRNELDGRRLSMQEMGQVVKTLREDIERVRREFAEFRAQHEREKREAAELIARNHRELEKEQRRSNRLQDEVLELRARLRSMWAWLRESNIQVPSYIERPGELDEDVEEKT